jgi:hypothetical protein
MPDKEIYYLELFKISSKFPPIVMIIPIIVAIVNYKDLNKILKIFFWYCVITFSLDISEHGLMWAVAHYKSFFVPILNKWEIKNTIFFQILYYLKNFAFLGYFFYELLHSHKSAKWIKRVSIFLFISSIINYLFIEGYKDWGIFNPTMDAFFCFLLPLYYMWHLFNMNTKVPISKNPYFWIGLGLISTALIGFFLFLTQDKLEKTDLTLFYKLAIFKNCIMIIEQFLEAVGFYYARYTKYLPQNTPSVK